MIVNNYNKNNYYGLVRYQLLTIFKKFERIEGVTGQT